MACRCSSDPTQLSGAIAASAPPAGPLPDVRPSRIEQAGSGLLLSLAKRSSSGAVSPPVLDLRIAGFE
jgi:hypothetical protein